MSVRTILVIILVPLALAVPVILVKLVTTDKDPILPDEHLRRYEVVTAEYYGIRLDEKTRPRDVAYVLVRGIQDAFKAAEAPTSEEQIEQMRRAREVQIATAAPETIIEVFEEMGLPLKEAEQERKNELVLRTILAWGRGLGFYRNGTHAEQRDEKWKVAFVPAGSNPSRAVVWFPAEKDEYHTYVVIKLGKEEGCWRIYQATIAAEAPFIPKAVSTTKPEAPPQAQPTTAPKEAKPAPKPAPKPETKPVAKQPPAKTPAPAKTPPTKPTAAPKPKPTTTAPPKKPTPPPPTTAKTKPTPKPAAKPPASKPTTTQGGTK